MSSILGFLGPPGSFTEEISLKYSRNNSPLILQEYKAIDELMEDVDAGLIEMGIVPVENSLEGSVNITLDMFVQLDVYIYTELIYPISHCLMALPGIELEDIKDLYSHVQAFSQCRKYLKARMPSVTQFPMESTAMAAEKISVLGGARAAIAPRRAAKLFGLEILASDIQDGYGEEDKTNLTRFVVISSHDHSLTGTDKTSIIFSIKDSPGSLYHILGVFAENGINLTRIESRPARKRLGEYLFFVDFEGHREEKKNMRALKLLEDQVKYLKMLGSYPSVYLPSGS